MLETLTDARLKAVKPPAKGRIELTDLRCSGLTFRVTDNGARSFSFRFRCPDTQAVNRMTLGKFPDLTLAKARQRADELRGQVANGINPALAAKRAKETAATRSFGAVAARYMEEHSRRNKAPSSIYQDETLLRLHILPKWKNRHIATLRRGDAVELLEGIVTSGRAVQANRVQSLISGIFNFAVDVDLLQASPVARMKQRTKERAVTRVLTDQEIRIFWPAVVRSPMQRLTGLALRLALLTLCRANEVCGMKRSEIENLGKPDAIWTIPGERTKNKKPHVIPLTPLAQDTIIAALEIIPPDAEYVFSSEKSALQHIRPRSLTMGMWRLKDTITGAGSETWKAKPPTPHDLRRTGNTNLSKLGVHSDDRGALLNHTRRDVQGRVYDQYDRLAEKRAALMLWDAALQSLIGGEQ